MPVYLKRFCLLVGFLEHLLLADCQTSLVANASCFQQYLVLFLHLLQAPLYLFYGKSSTGIYKLIIVVFLNYFYIVWIWVIGAKVCSEYNVVSCLLRDVMLSTT